MEYNTYKTIWSPSAKNDLNNIFYHILHVFKNTLLAKKIKYEIINSVNSLRFYPYRNPILFLSNHQNDVPIRKFKFKNYVIIYSIDSNKSSIYILRLFHISQDYFHLL